MSEPFNPPPDSPVPDALQPPAPPAPKRRRAWVWWVLGGLALLLLALAWLPTLLGGVLLGQFGKDAGISAGRVQGPLWAPRLDDLTFQQPGLQVQAGQASVSVASLNPLTKTVRLNVTARDATVNLKLQELFNGLGGSGGGGGGGWKVLISDLNVQNTRLNVNGQGVNIPDGQFSVNRADSGQLAVRGRTVNGQLNADVAVTEGAGGNIFTVDLNADATVLNHYWPGVTAGTIQGRYVLGDGPVRGDLKIVDAALTVPEAKFVTVTGIQGAALHRGDQITLKLAGRGWDGPVTAEGGVDLKAQNWTVSANATPSLAGFARSLGTTGEGQMRLRVTAGGWSTVRVKGYVQAAGKLAGVPFNDAKAEYTFLNRDGAKSPQTNDIAFSANTELAGARQRLEGQWAFGRKGQATLRGALAEKPLNVQASIDAQNVMTLRGQGLGGPLEGTLALDGLKIDASLRPTYGAANARVALSGTPDNLKAIVTDGIAGPFPLSGVVTLNSRGLQADLSGVQLDLNRDFKGTWQARDLNGAGRVLTLNGAGRIDLTGGDVTGTMQVQVLGLPDALRGPLNVNYVNQRGTFAPGKQLITWRGDRFGLNARNLRVPGGVAVSGDVTITTALKAYGTLRARGSSFNVTADAQGTTARLRGDVAGITVLADTELQQPFNTVARVQGADVRGTLNVGQNGINFTLNTAGERAQGVINGENYDVTGRVNLRALRPLVGLKDLSGTLDLNLRGQGGGARVNALAQGARITGTLTRAGTPVSANLTVSTGEISGQVRGQVYPDVRATGTVMAAGQRLNLAVSGPYSALRATATGRTGELSFGGVTLPAQSVNLSGSLTPRLALSGTWGDLSVAYNGGSGQVRVTGSQNLTAFGQAGRLGGRATWGPGPAGSFKGGLDVSGVLDQYTLRASGPWSALNLLVTDAEGLQAQGTASLPDGRYDVRVRGPVAGGTAQGGLYVDGNIQGRGSEPQGQVRVLDGQGGRATVNLRGFSDFDVVSQGLTLAGQAIVGRLTARNDLLSGALTAGPLRVTADRGLIRVNGELAGQQVNASGRVTLPATVNDLRLSVNGPYFSALARGGVADLRGTLTLKAQTLGSDPARLSIPAQSYPLRASLTGLRAVVGGLTYQGGRYGGSLSARYDLSGRGGTVQIVGTGPGLAAVPAGPVAGRLNLIPSLGGTLSANLSPFLSALPAEVRREVQGGLLVAQISSGGAQLKTRQTTYQGQPLGLDARVNWQPRLSVRGVLTHPGSRIPVNYDGQNLLVQNASLDARTLRPVLDGAQGMATLNLSVPGLDFAQASGRARLNISAQGQRAVGLVTLTRGQLAADLTSTLAGVALRVSGPLYPQANALLTYEDIRATLRGNADQTLTLRASGTYQSKALDLSAQADRLTAGKASVRLNGVYAGAALTATLQQGRGAGLNAWTANGTLSVPDLKPLTGTAGWVNATLSGPLSRLRLYASGEAAGIRFTAPGLYENGELRVQGLSAQLTQGQVRATGFVFPNLNLSARATLNEALPGTYTAQVRGTFNRPDVKVQGVLTRAVSGLQASGTRLNARLYGRDWRVTFQGSALDGQARGQLGANALGGLLDTRLNLNTAYRSGDTDLRLSGNPGWNARSGWQGKVRAVGDLPGGPLDAVLDGQGALNLAAVVGLPPQQARLTGTLPASLPFRPGGTLNLSAFDIGALWQREGQLRLTGQATLAGRNWSAPEATFNGRVQDSAAELSGDLGATYRAGNVSVRLAGPQVAGGGTLDGGRYQLTLRAQPVRLARLLPPGWGVDALTFAGRVEAQGTLSGGPSQLLLSGVALRGQQRQAGPFSLYGNATYTPATLQAALSGSLRGGVLGAQGQLPGGLRLTVRDLNTAYLDAASFGRGVLNADLTLRGQASDPRVEGTATVTTTDLDALLTLGGQVRNPQAHVRATLKGQNSGTVYADARDLNLAAGTVRAHLYGTLASGGNRVKLDLDGVWPQMTGQVQATLAGLNQPLELRADGRGNYLLQDGELGSGTLRLSGGQGFLPNLSGTLNLTPLPLLPGSEGQLRVNTTLAGTLAEPTVAASLTARDVTLYGVKLAATNGTITGKLAALSGQLSQAGKTVGTLKGDTLTLDALAAEVAGSALKVQGQATLDGTADLNVSASGLLQGDLNATYRAQALAVKGTLRGPQSLQANLDVRADPLTGWHGTTRLAGGPTGSLTRPLNLTLAGPLAHPLVTGEGGLLGASARIVATPRGVQLRLADGRVTQASGVLELRPDDQGAWTWSGAASLSRPELSISVTPSGPIGDPQVLLSVRRGEWRASGPVSLKAADLNLTDGTRSGRVTWQAEQLSANLPGLNLATLGIERVKGIVTASGTVSTGTQDGQLSVNVSGLNTDYTIPYLDIALNGELSANVTLRGGKPTVQAIATLPAGTLNLTALQGAQHWTGRLTGTLNRAAERGQGTLDVNVGADSGGLSGLLRLASYPVNVQGQDLRVQGDLRLEGQTFTAALDATNSFGKASVDASGGIADLLPALEGALAVRPTGDGYSLRAVLDELEISRLKIAPDLSGRVSGEANLRDGGGTFSLQSAALKIGPRTLPARLRGTQVAGDWRIQGVLGDGPTPSEFTAGLSGDEVFGSGTLRALPIGALIGAFTGSTPGEGVVTGVVRFRFPLANPPAGSATLVAERIRVSATSGEGAAQITETLTGSGTVDLANGEVRNINVQLAGAGTWDIRGQYTRENVNLSAQFTNTTFTPVLHLVPALADLDTSLKGTVTLSAAGSYQRPRGLLRVQNVQGTVAGLSLQVPEFSGELPDSGAFTGSGSVLTGGSVGSNGQLDIRGQLTLGKLSGTTATFKGLLAPQALGALPNTTVTLTQTTESTWTLGAQSTTQNPTTGAGTLTLNGQLAPRWDLTLSARNYNLPLNLIYGRESALNADLRAVDDGTTVRVSGAADFQRLVLGRVNAPTTIPAPGETTTSTSDKEGVVNRATDNYPSPLPEQYRIFPKPTTPGQEAVKRERPFLERLVFEDIPIRAPNGIRVDENLVRADFTGNLTLSGSGARPRLNGEVRSQRGFIYLRENEFTLTDGLVSFSGNDLYPKFNLSALGFVPSSTTNQRVPITLDITGEFVSTASSPVLSIKTTLSCNPADRNCLDPGTSQAYTEAQLYALVATGVPNLTALPGNLTTLGTSALQTALNVFILGEIERTIARAFGLDVFRFTPSVASNGDLSATITIGSYLSRNLYLQYQVDLTGNGLIDATYNTPDNRFTFKVSTPITGLDLTTLRPSFSVSYNISSRTSLNLGIQTSETNTKIRFGATYYFGGR